MLGFGVVHEAPVHRIGGRLKAGVGADAVALGAVLQGAVHGERRKDQHIPGAKVGGLPATAEPLGDFQQVEGEVPGGIVGALDVIAVGVVAAVGLPEPGKAGQVVGAGTDGQRALRHLHVSPRHPTAQDALGAAANVDVVEVDAGAAAGGFDAGQDLRIEHRRRGEVACEKRQKRLFCVESSDGGQPRVYRGGTLALRIYERGHGIGPG